MVVVFFSPSFLPRVGGLENIMNDWATELTRLGHRVDVINLTTDQGPQEFPFSVHRNIGSFRTWQLMRKANIVIHFNLSLKGLLPTLLSFRPFVISHQTTNYTTAGRFTRFGWMKQFIAEKFATVNIACSGYVGSFFKKALVIPNSYNSVLFKRINGIERANDLLFVGRLVSDKGCELIIRALGILKRIYNVCLTFDIIGDGPEKKSLIDLALSEDVDSQVRFFGKLSGEALVRAYNSHKLLIVPSTWEEPFGIVALEGLACGCKVIVARSGGLPEAVGAVGYIFDKGNHVQLASIIMEILANRHNDTQDQHVISHLMAFSLDATVQRLIRALHSV